MAKYRYFGWAWGDSLVIMSWWLRMGVPVARLATDPTVGQWRASRSSDHPHGKPLALRQRQAGTWREWRAPAHASPGRDPHGARRRALCLGEGRGWQGRVAPILNRKAVRSLRRSLL